MMILPNYRCLFFTLLGAIVLALPCFGGPVVLDSRSSKVPLLQSALYIIDRSAVASLEEIQQSKEFAPLPGGMIPAGFEETVYWFKWNIINQDPRFPQQIFQIDPPWFLDSTLYLVREDGSVAVHLIGQDRAFWDSELPHPSQIAPTEIPFGESVEVFLRIRVYIGQLDLSLWRPQAFLVADWQRIYLLALLMGVLLAVSLYNLFLYFSIRDSVYLYYVIAAVCGLLYGMNNEGISSILWPNFPHWDRRSFVVFAGLGHFAHLMFARKFLNTPEHAPFADKLLFPLMGFALVVALFITQMYHWGPIYPLLASVMVLCCAPIMSGLGIYIYLIKKQPQARLYALGSTFLQVWLIVQMGQLFGAWGEGLNLIRGATGILFGFAVMDLVLSFALAERINWLRVDKNRANQALIELKSSEAERLSQQVQQRTLELTELTEHQQLLIGIIAHDLRGPAGGVSTLLRDMCLSKEGVDRQELKVVAQSALDLHWGLEDLLKWAKSLQKGVQLERVPLDFIPNIYEPVWSLVKHTAHAHGVSLHLDVKSPEVFGEMRAIQAVLRNLVTNAIKAAPIAGSVSIQVVDHPTFSKVSVINEGLSLNQAQIAALNEDHIPQGLTSGLGLLVCRQLVRCWKGEIGFQLTLSGQTEVSFTLPKPETPPGALGDVLGSKG